MNLISIFVSPSSTGQAHSPTRGDTCLLPITPSTTAIVRCNYFHRCNNTQPITETFEESEAARPYQRPGGMRNKILDNSEISDFRNLRYWNFES